MNTFDDLAALMRERYGWPEPIRRDHQWLEWGNLRNFVTVLRLSQGFTSSKTVDYETGKWSADTWSLDEAAAALESLRLSLKRGEIPALDFNRLHSQRAEAPDSDLAAQGSRGMPGRDGGSAALGLKHCPFCGGAQQVVMTIAGQNAVSCLDCGATTRQSPTEEGAVRNWNRRPGDPEPNPDEPLVRAIEHPA